MRTGIIELYLGLSQECEMRVRSPQLSRDMLGQALAVCRDRIVGHLWIGLHPLLLQDQYFLTVAQELADLLHRKFLDQVTLQCHVSGLENVTIDPILSGFNLSLLVCEAPPCGAKPSNTIIRTYLRAKTTFRRVAFTGASPFTCVYGVHCGTNIRVACLMRQYQVFALPAGEVQRCPVGRFASIGNWIAEPLSIILTRFQADLSNFVLQGPSDPAALGLNVCAECLDHL